MKSQYSYCNKNTKHSPCKITKYQGLFKINWFILTEFDNYIVFFCKRRHKFYTFA